MAKRSKSPKYMRLRRPSSKASYLELRDFPRDQPAGCSARTVLIHQLIEGYDGPALILDIDKNGRAIGIEILYPSGDDDSDD